MRRKTRVVSIMGKQRKAAWLGRGGAIAGMVLLLSACAGTPYDHRPAPEPSRPIPRSAPPSGPVIAPPPIQTPQAPRAPSVQRSHPRYAPPPYGSAHWDNRLGVYVVEGTELFYRDRLYYRWDGDWFCAGRPDGPWEPVAPPSVPPGLRGHR